MGAPKGHPPYPGCETGGRPVEWTPDRIEDIRLKLESWMKIPTNFWFDDFVIEYDLPTDIVARLANKSEKFRATYKKAVMIQQSRMFKAAVLSKKMSTAALIFGLKCNHGWNEGQDRMKVYDDDQPNSMKGLAGVKETVIAHTNTIQQTGDKPS